VHSGKYYVGKPVIGNQGRRLGTVKDLYLDRDLTAIVGVYLGSEGLHSRKQLRITRTDLTVFGPHAVLAAHDDVVIDAAPACEAETWLRRDRPPGRPVTTAGGTQVGSVDDVILDDEMRVVGIQLGRIFVEGPVNDNRAIAREAVVDVGNQGAMIIDLNTAEQQHLKSV
jgi:sporulation protein YlmC with PRC-barrel domain